MKVRWRWKWDESYLTRTRRGERNRRGKEQTPTHKNQAQSGQTLKGQGKRKAEADGHRTRPAEGGGRTEAPKPTYHSETYAYLSTRRTQPTCREENTWNRGHMGDQLMKWCIHMKCNCRDKAQGPRYSSQPHGQLTSSTLELRAHLNLTKVTKRKSLKACPIAWPKHDMWQMKSVCLSSIAEKRRLLSRLQFTNPWKSDKNGEVSHSGRLFNQKTTDRVKPEMWTASPFRLDPRGWEPHFVATERRPQGALLTRWQNPTFTEEGFCYKMAVQADP